MKAAIIIMCKAPNPGAVKTRLTAFLSPENAADLAVCFAIDTTQKAQTVCENTIIAVAGDKNLLAENLSENLILIEQRGTDLGERMHNALSFAFLQNFSPLVVIGTDSPTLPAEFIEYAIEILSKKHADAVLGAAEDGGYYLIGLNEPNLQIFQHVTWSTSETFAETRRNIEQANLRLAVLPVWCDVDTPEDLRRLKTEIENDSRSRNSARTTAAWFEKNARLFF
jgi:hypothetical protein